MVKMLLWFSDVVATLTCAAPPQRGVSDSRDWMPSTIAPADLASPYFVAMADRDAAWYQERNGLDGR
jgi:hypothetical protein